jgi:hypothetical protein
MKLTKLVLHFSDFSVSFYDIYKKQEINLTIGVHLLQRGPWKDFCVCDVAPGGAAGAAPVKFRRARRRSWPGKGRGRSYEALGVDLQRIWGGLYRRGCSTAAAGGRRCAPSSGEVGRPVA